MPGEQTRPLIKGHAAADDPGERGRSRPSSRTRRSTAQ